MPVNPARPPRPWVNGLLPLVGRLLIVAEFVVAANGKLTGWSGQAAYMGSHGLPFVPILLFAATVIEVVGSLCLIARAAARPAAAVMFVYLGIVSVSLHNYWSMPEAAAGANLTQFYKNLGIMGGLLMIVAYGPGTWSLATRRRRHDPEQGQLIATS